MDLLFTQRLFLEPLLVTDADPILALRSDPRVNQYLDRTPMTTKEEAVAFVEKIRKGYRAAGVKYWAIRQEKNGDLLGTVCLWNFSEDQLSAELGYELHPDFQGKGYMRETIREVIRYAFENLGIRKLSAFTHKQNNPSIRVLVENGFKGPVDRPVNSTHDDFIFILEQPSS